MEKVMVVGLRKEQARRVEAALPTLTFSFVEMAKKVGSKWKHFDTLVLMTKFLSHAYRIDNQHGCEIVYCNGSVSRLVDQLKEKLS